MIAAARLHTPASTPRNLQERTQSTARSLRVSPDARTTRDHEKATSDHQMTIHGHCEPPLMWHAHSPQPSRGEPLAQPPGPFLTPRLLSEDAQRHEGAHHPVRGVHHLAHLQIDRHARQRVRLLAGQPVLAHQVATSPTAPPSSSPPSGPARSPSSRSTARCWSSARAARPSGTPLLSGSRGATTAAASPSCSSRWP